MSGIERYTDRPGKWCYCKSTKVFFNVGAAQGTPWSITIPFSSVVIIIVTV